MISDPDGGHQCILWRNKNTSELHRRQISECVLSLFLGTWLVNCSFDEPYLSLFFFRYLELDLYKKKTQIFHGLWNAPNKRGTRKRRTMQLKTFHLMYGCRLNDCMKTTQSLSQSLCQCRSFSWAASSAVTKNNNYTLPVMRVFFICLAWLI